MAKKVKVKEETYWALCNKCYLDILQIFLRENSIGAICPNCNNKVFEFKDIGLKDLRPQLKNTLPNTPVKEKINSLHRPRKKNKLTN